MRNSKVSVLEKAHYPFFFRAERDQRKYSETEIRPEDSGDVSAAAWKT